ncbi:hypothetical protein GGI35DRAFT_87961 [Trichoderma velutinum]
MVYCGKPSEACKPCRVKRRKCNLKRPMCSSCINLGIDCHGYRDIKLLSIRDQTTMVIQREQNKINPKWKSKRAGDARPYSEGNEHIWPWSSATNPGPAAAMPIHIDDLAISYFMLIFSISSSFHYIPHYWVELVKEDNSFELSMRALSLAALSLDCRQHEMLIAARGCYTKALMRINNALSCANDVTLDSTLLSVLFLGAFEAIISCEQGSAANWTAHIQGTTTLLILRGKEQLDSPLGKNLFTHASTNIRTSCAQRSVPVPPALIRLQEHASSMLNIPTTSRRLGPLLDRFTAIKARLDIMPPVECIYQSLCLDTELEHLMHQLFLTSPYKIIEQASEHENDPNGPCNRPRHQYSSAVDARRWNVVRMLRLFVNEWACRAYACLLDRNKLDSTEAPLESWQELPDTAAFRVEKIIDDIIASVPSSLENFGAISAHSVRFLIWPLLSIGASEFAPVSARLYAISTLKLLSSKYDEPLANEAAKTLETGAHVEEWFRIPADCALFVSI